MAFSIPALTLYTAAIGTGYSVYSGERAAGAQKKAVIRQKEAQAVAENQAMADSRRQEEQQKRANRRQPDITSLLADQQAAASAAGGDAYLTGASGIEADQLKLSRRTLLGG